MRPALSSGKVRLRLGRGQNEVDDSETAGDAAMREIVPPWMIFHS